MLATIGHPQWMMLARVAILPSLFTAMLHSMFCGANQDHFADQAFSSETDSITQGIFSVLAFTHVIFYAINDWFVGKQQRVKVVDFLRLQGHESVVNINCGRGFWSNEIAHRLDSGRVWGVDSWGSSHTPFDQQWLIYNSACEGTNTKLETAGSWDLYTLPFLCGEHDVVLSSWLPWYDEVGAERVMHEMMRCIKPGGRICVVLPKFYHNCVEDILHELGVLELNCQNITTGRYVSHQVYTGIKSTLATSTRTRGHSVADQASAEELQPQIWFFLLGLCLWLLHLLLFHAFWDELQFPAGVSPSNQMGASFVSPNVTWLGLALVEIHMEMTMRPGYVLRQYGWSKAWRLIGLHHSMTALLWNLGCWIPGLLVELIFQINNSMLHIALSVPCIALVMHMEEKLLSVRMRCFVSAFDQMDSSALPQLGQVRPK